MELVVVSSPDKLLSEVKAVVDLMDAGMTSFHLRKPKFSFSKIEKYLDHIPERYHKNIITHSHHKLLLKYNLKGIHLTKKHKEETFRTWWMLKRLKLTRKQFIVTSSFHSLLSLLENNKDYEYCFLSPIFESISKVGYRGDFTDQNLISILGRTKQNIYALGGIKASNIELTHSLGFAGVGVLGTIWTEGNDYVKEFLLCKKVCDDLKGVAPQIDNTLSQSFQTGS